MDEAGAWLAGLQRDDVGESDGLAFEAWLDPANFGPDGRQRRSLAQIAQSLG